MKIVRSNDSKAKGKDSGKMKEAYENEDKAPRKGVKAQDQDEYQAKGSFWDKSVEKAHAYREQAKASPGTGSRGGSQADGGPIEYWDKSVDKGKARSEQCAWGEADNNSAPSLGFKMGENANYLGHFKGEKFLREGHNDGGIMDYFSGNKPASPSPSPSPEPDNETTKDMRDSGRKSMRKAFGSDD